MKKMVRIEDKVKPAVKKKRREQMRLFISSLANAFLSISILLFTYCLNTFSVFATTTIVVQDGDWNDDATWNTGSVPTSSDSVIIQNGFEVVVDGDFTCEVLTIIAPNTDAETELVIENGESLTVLGDLTLNGGIDEDYIARIIFEGNSVLTIAGNLAINASIPEVAEIDMSDGASILNLAGDFIVNTYADWFSGSLSTVNFNGSSPQIFPVSFDIEFNNIHFNNSSTTGATIDTAMTPGKVLGHIRIQSGIFENSSYEITGNTGSTFEVANGATLILEGATSFPAAFSTVLLGTTSIVDYAGDASQTISSYNYGHLICSNTGDRTLPSGSIVGIASSFTPGTNSFTITGSTIDYNGTATEEIARFNYYNLTSSSTGARILPPSLTIRIAASFNPGT
ncbi:hypothetical protein JYT51_00960, partial [Candidatus Amoebophilus asiaticus]|nr:hypothetical protein [Candidatus Amoebophilus asiaticus]